MASRTSKPACCCCRVASSGSKGCKKSLLMSETREKWVPPDLDSHRFLFVPGCVPVAGAHAVVRVDFAAFGEWLRFRAEIESNVLPRVARLPLEAETGGRLVAAVDHAVFAADILR